MKRRKIKQAAFRLSARRKLAVAVHRDATPADVLAGEDLPSVEADVPRPLRDRVAVLSLDDLLPKLDEAGGGEQAEADATEQSVGEEQAARLEGIARRPGVKAAGLLLRAERGRIAFLTPRIIVRFRRGAPPAAHELLEAAFDGEFGLRALRRLPYIPGGWRFELNRNRQRVLTLCRRIMREHAQHVLYAEPEIVTNLRPLSPDARYAEQVNLERIAVQGAWIVLQQRLGPEFRYGHPEVRVAVVDGQVDTAHHEFEKALSDGGPRILDPDWDFYWEKHGRPPADWHGTGAAGIIAAAADDHEIRGVAPNCRLITAAVDLKNTVELMDAVWWAAGLDPGWSPGARGREHPELLPRGADVISASWDREMLEDAAEDFLLELVQQGRDGLGTVVVFAAGEPAQYENYAFSPHVIAVGAVVPDGAGGFQRDAVSRSGHQVDVVAPTDVLTCDIYNQYLQPMGGTSAATPHVAGVAALMLSVNPNLAWSDVREILQQTATRQGLPAASFLNNVAPTDAVPDPAPSADFGYGRVDAEQAVAKARDYLPTLTVAIEDPAPGSLNVGQPVPLRIEVGQHGQTRCPSATLTVTVELDRPGQGFQIVDGPRSIPLAGPNAGDIVEHAFVPPEPGNYRIVAKLEADQGRRGAMDPVTDTKPFDVIH